MSPAVGATYGIAQNRYTPIVVGVLVVGATVASYFFVIKPILEGLGLKDTKFDARLRYLDGFNPQYYKTKLSKVTISTQMSAKLATDVYLSYGLVNDDEEKLIGAIQSAGSQENLSKVSETFQKMYNKSMIEYIMSFANNEDTEAIYKIIKDW